MVKYIPILVEFWHVHILSIPGWRRHTVDILPIYWDSPRIMCGFKDMADELPTATKGWLSLSFEGHLQGGWLNPTPPLRPFYKDESMDLWDTMSNVKQNLSKPTSFPVASRCEIVTFLSWWSSWITMILSFLDWSLPMIIPIVAG